MHAQQGSGLHVGGDLGVMLRGGKRGLRFAADISAYGCNSGQGVTTERRDCEISAAHEHPDFRYLRLHRFRRY